MMMKTFVKVKVLGHHGIIWGHNISGQGTCHRDDTDMSSFVFFFCDEPLITFMHWVTEDLRPYLSKIIVNCYHHGVT